MGSQFSLTSRSGRSDARPLIDRDGDAKVVPGNPFANGAGLNGMYGTLRNPSRPSTPGTPGSPKPKSRLLTYEESKRLVPWQTDNAFIRSGYRRQLFSIRSCLWSSFGYIHNETVNIHTHSIGALFFAALLPLHLFAPHFPTLGVFPSPDSSTPLATLADKVGVTVYFLSAVTCLGLSSWFHTVQCCSREVCVLANCGDYIGIVVLIVGSILPGLYYGFHDNRPLMYTYMAGITIAGLFSGHVVLSPHHRKHKWHRTLTFIGLGLSAVVPVGHVVLTKGLEYARNRMGVSYVVAGAVSYITGALLYAAHIPESLAPGKFDYLFASHQIFHCFVLAGAWFQFAALRWMSWGAAVAGVEGVGV